MLPSNCCCGDFFALHVIGGDRDKHSRIGLLNLINGLFLELKADLRRWIHRFLQAWKSTTWAYNASHGLVLMENVTVCRTSSFDWKTCPICYYRSGSSALAWAYASCHWQYSWNWPRLQKAHAQFPEVCHFSFISPALLHDPPAIMFIFMQPIFYV